MIVITLVIGLYGMEPTGGWEEGVSAAVNASASGDGCVTDPVRSIVQLVLAPRVCGNARYSIYATRSEPIGLPGPGHLVALDAEAKFPPIEKHPSVN